MEWEEFLTENGRGSWSVMWNPETGTPDAVYGKGLATGDELTTIEAGRVEAEAPIKKYADLLGMGDSKFAAGFLRQRDGLEPSVCLRPSGKRRQRATDSGFPLVITPPPR
jgi:hypothetical protein